MLGKSRPSDEDIEELNSSLLKGLESCRSMVANYREMISGEHIADNDEVADDAANAKQA